MKTSHLYGQGMLYVYDGCLFLIKLDQTILDIEDLPTGHRCACIMNYYGMLCERKLLFLAIPYHGARTVPMVTNCLRCTRCRKFSWVARYSAGLSDFRLDYQLGCPYYRRSYPFQGKIRGPCIAAAREQVSHYYYFVHSKEFV